MRNVIVFGNDESIDKVDFNTVDNDRKGTNTLTLGINRIWRRYMPDIIVSATPNSRANRYLPYVTMTPKEAV